MKQTPIRKRRYRKPTSIHKDIVPNPEGGKTVFWVVYIVGMVIYMVNIIK